MTNQHPITPPPELVMIKRVNIKKILKDPLKRSKLIEGAVDFICKVEGIAQ